MRIRQTEIRRKVLPLVAVLVLVLLTVLILTEYRVELKHLAQYHAEQFERAEQFVNEELKKNAAVFQKRTTADGCLELTQDFQRIQEDVKHIIKVETLVLLEKSLFDRDAWKQKQAATGAADNWQEYDRYVVINQTLDVLPEKFGRYMMQTKCLKTETCSQTPAFELFDKTYLTSCFPLCDSGGETLGRVFVFRDITRSIASISATALFYGLVSLSIGGFIYGFFYIYIGRIEKRLAETYKNQSIEIVHRKFAEAQLKEAKDRAEAASLAKSQFMANMSHELRTPMNAIMGFTELLKDEPLNDEQFDYVETIHSSSQHLLELINDVLDLSKIEAGRMEIKADACSPKEILSQIDTMMRQGAEVKGLTFEVDSDPEVPELMLTDAKHLYQCLINLVGNAIKFTDRGYIRVHAGVLKDSSISHVRFRVEDSGIGVPKDKHAQIFESFRQADASTSRKYGGTGLGLSISRQLIELMGGTLTVQSEEGKGTTFTIVLPYECPVESKEPSEL